MYFYNRETLLLLASILPLSVDEDRRSPAPTTTAHVPLKSPLVSDSSETSNEISHAAPVNSKRSRHVSASACNGRPVNAYEEKNEQQLQQPLAQNLITTF
jgi:hypothetical protein